jgi:hypothetical protein
MIGPGIARELARERELAIIREVERRRTPRGARAGEFLPSMSIVVGALLLLALGAPMP